MSSSGSIANKVARVAGQMAGSAAQSYLNNWLATAANQKMGESYTATTTKKKKKSNKRGAATGVFVGPFKKPKRKFLKKHKKNHSFAGKGVMRTVETYGTVTDADCIYVGHSTYNLGDLAKTICQAVIRKLLVKAGYALNSVNQVIPVNGGAGGVGGVFEWTVSSPTGVETPTAYSLVATSTINSTSTLSGFENSVLGYLSGDSANMHTSVRFLQFIGVEGTRCEAQLNLLEEILTVMCSSNLSVQNRTRPATGTSTTTEAVDNQPLKGRLYRFAGGVPKLMPTAAIVGTAGPSPLTRVDGTGVILARASEFPVPTEWREPPLPKIWSNSVAGSNVNLQPGNIKKTYIRSYWKGYFNNILYKLRVVDATVATRVTYVQSPGKCEILALEEALNSGSTNLITVTYECDKRYGAMLYTTKKPQLCIEYGENIYNNLAA